MADSRRFYPKMEQRMGWGAIAQINRREEEGGEKICDQLLLGLRYASRAAGMSCVAEEAGGDGTSTTCCRPLAVSVLFFVALKATVHVHMAVRAVAAPSWRIDQLALVVANVAASVICFATDGHLAAALALLQHSPAGRCCPGRRSSFWAGIAMPLLVCLLEWLLRANGGSHNDDWCWYVGFCYHRTGCFLVIAEFCALLVYMRTRLRLLNERLAALATKCSPTSVRAAQLTAHVEIESVRASYELLASVNEHIVRSMGWRFLLPMATLPLELLFRFYEFVTDGRVRSFTSNSPVYLLSVAAIHLVAILSSDICLQVKLFAEHIRARPLKYTAANFLPIDKKLVISIFSLVATYCVVILQLCVTDT